MDTMTRWNSTYDMLIRNLQFMMQLTNDLLANGHKDLLLSADEWDDTQSLANILAPFKEVIFNITLITKYYTRQLCMFKNRRVYQ